MEAAPDQNGTPESVSAKGELPTVESPPTSPASEAAVTPEPEAEPVKAEAPEPINVPAILFPPSQPNRRRRRRVLCCGRATNAMPCLPPR